MSERISLRGNFIQFALLGNYILAIGLALLVHFSQSPFFDWQLYRNFYLFAAAGLALRTVTIFASDYFFSRDPLYLAAHLLDVGLISTLFYLSDLNPALFLMMYLVVIFTAGIVLGRRGGFSVAAFSSMGFSLAALLGPDIKSLSFSFIFIVNNVSFFALAWIAGHLSEQFEIQGVSLRILERIHRLIVDAVPVGLMTVTPEGEILTSNPTSQKILSQQNLEGSGLIERVPALKSLWENFGRLQKVLDSEVVDRKLDGSSQILKVEMLPISNAKNDPSVIMIEDLTEIRKLELDVRQKEKLAAVGALAAGIAHEIRNPLASISGSIELLGQGFISEEDQKLHKIVLKEIDRLNRLISDFLDYAKPEAAPTEVVSLHAIIKESLAAISQAKQWEGKIKANLNLEGVGNVRGNSDKLRQVFYNFILNAFEAMLTVPSAEISIATRERDGQMVVTIQDNGIGMKPETQKRLFEPFHTTKPRGTGLGLAMTHKILQAHRAQIEVRSEVGRGTEIKVAFPSVQV